MTKDEAINIANSMAFMACIWIDDEGPEINDLVELVRRIEDKVTAEVYNRANSSWALMCEKMVANEREECAKLADEWVKAYPHPSTVIAERIRARGNP